MVFDCSTSSTLTSNTSNLTFSIVLWRKMILNIFFFLLFDKSNPTTVFWTKEKPLYSFEVSVCVCACACVEFHCNQMATLLRAIIIINHTSSTPLAFFSENIIKFSPFNDVDTVWSLTIFVAETKNCHSLFKTHDTKWQYHSMILIVVPFVHPTVNFSFCPFIDLVHNNWLLSMSFIHV